jgi:hypothetical protein
MIAPSIWIDPITGDDYFLTPSIRSRMNRRTPSQD